MQHHSPPSVILLHVEQDFGHGPKRPKEIEVIETANKVAFVKRCIGPIDQARYKQSLVASPSMNDDSEIPSRPTTPERRTASAVPRA